MKKTIYGVVLIFVVLSIFAAAHPEKIKKPVTFAQVYDINTYEPEVPKVQVAAPTPPIVAKKTIIHLNRPMVHKAWVEDSYAMQRHLNRTKYNQ